LVQGLVRRHAPDAMLDARSAPPEHVGQPVAVDTAGPARVPGAIVFLGPLPFEHRLRAAVPDLLLPVSAHRVAAVVPDHRGGAESKRPAPLLEAPTHVHVVAGGAELRVEPSDRLEAGFAERHVAARNVFGLT